MQSENEIDVQNDGQMINFDLFFEEEYNMGLEKAIEHGKEKRKPYYGTKSFARSCRNHGGCDYCKGSRLHSSNKRETAAEQRLKEIELE